MYFYVFYIVQASGNLVSGPLYESFNKIGIWVEQTFSTPQIYRQLEDLNNWKQ